MYTKPFLFILMGLLYAACNTGNTKKQQQQGIGDTINSLGSETDTLVADLPEFEIHEIYGKWNILISKTSVYWKGDTCYAERSLPAYLETRPVDSVWTTRLDRDQITFCLRFLDMTRKFDGRSCPPSTKNRESYTVVFKDNTYHHVNAACTGQDLKFHTIDSAFFYEKHVAAGGKNKFKRLSKQ